ncbi:MAG: sugar transferase [Nitrospira sp.]|jgi:lipopolysaccharide/colanic/teichoic acid biosynthesis glycosyltransferase/dTDP-glucose pyrophosphorylase
MKAILLAGWQNWYSFPIQYSMSCLPFLNRPLILYQLDALWENGITEVAIAISAQGVDAVKAILATEGPRPGLRIQYVVDTVPRGPAGCIKQCEEFVGREPFCAINGNLYLNSIDLKGFFRSHLAVGGIATLGVIGREAANHSLLENIVSNEDGLIRGFEILHHSRERRKQRRFAGIYAFRPEVFEHIPKQGYADIKEQLLPALSSNGFAVNLRDIRGFHSEISGPGDYLKVHQIVLHQTLFDENRYVLLADRVWCEKGAQVSPSAHVIGPVLLGRNCVIGDDAYVIGPAVIGDGTRLSEGSLVRESILGQAVVVSRVSKVEYSIVGDRYQTEEHGRTRDCVVTCDRVPVKLTITEHTHPWSRKQHILPSSVTCNFRKVCKRTFDLVVAALILLVLSPLFLVIGTVIKLDSPGPVFFRQPRCGLGGREFKMIKFRSMRVDAEALQAQFWEKKSVDGPMFKMAQDPRVTRAGRFLRSSSLDELPQLFNVLRSQMSLVGPRPLAMGEMRFAPSWRDARLSVKPGMTGLWQVSGRSEAAFHDWIRYDMQYVRNFSLWLDAKILLKTMRVVANRIGAC